MVKLTHRQIWALFLVPILVFTAVGIADTVFLTNDVEVQEEIGLGAKDTGVMVHLKGSADVELSGDWAKSDRVILHTSKGNITVMSQGASEATIQFSEINGTFTNVTNIQAPNANITFDPDDKHRAAVRGDIDTFNFTQIAANDGDIDFVYSGSGTSGSIKVGNLSSKQQYAMIRGDNAVDVAVADSRGEANFTDPPIQQSSIKIRNASVVTVRNERENHTPVGGCGVNAKFYELEDLSPLISEREDVSGGGNISVRGLPVDTEYVVDISCDGHFTRSIVVPNIGQQQEIFILNKSAESAEVTFAVTDRTGRFGSGDGTRFIIERAIDRTLYDNSSTNAPQEEFEWISVAGDRLGPEEAFTAHLQNGTRYRIRVRNGRGDERILGQYVVRGDAFEEVTIGRVTWDVPEGSLRFFNATMPKDRSEIQLFYRDKSDNSTNLQVRIWERGNKSNEILNDSPSGSFGTYAANQPLTGDQRNKTWVANIQYEIDGETVEQQRLVGSRVYEAPGAQWLIGVLILFALTIIGAMFGPNTAIIGAITLSTFATLIAVLQVYTLPTALLIAAWAISLGGVAYKTGKR